MRNARLNGSLCVHEIPYPQLRAESSMAINVEGAACGGSVTVHVNGEKAVTTTKDTKVGVVKAAFRPAVPAVALFGVQGTSWGLVSVNTERLG